MATIRLVMEKYVDKNYSGHAYSFNGYHAKWTLSSPKNPLYEVVPHETGAAKTILMGCEPNTVVKLCRVSYTKILEYERKHGARIVWSTTDHGYVVACDSRKGTAVYPIETVITGSDAVEHVDGDPLNNTWDNLRVSEW